MINVAVIGTGYIGPVHIEALRRISGITVKGVTDANPELARKTAEKYNIEKVYRDYTRDPGRSRRSTSSTPARPTACTIP